MTQNINDFRNKIENILNDPYYDQSHLQRSFQEHYGDQWKMAWQQYLETGRLS